MSFPLITAEVSYQRKSGTTETGFLENTKGARISLDDIYSSIIDIYKRNLLPSAYRANPPKIYFFDMTITSQGSKTYKGL